MSHLVVGSSNEVAAFGNHSTFSVVAHSLSTHQSCTMNSHEIQPIVVKSPAYIFGERVVGPLFRMACRVASCVYQNWPSFSLPGAAASSITEAKTPICPTPTGSYEASCHKPEVSYSSVEGQCVLTTRCATSYEGLPHQRTRISFSPGADVVLENINGTLVVQGSRIDKMNARLEELTLTSSKPETLLKEQAAIIGDLLPGDVITVDSGEKTSVLSPEKWPKKDEGFVAFQRIAQATGGILGYASSADSLDPLIKKMSAHILKTAGASKFIDIALVVDTTGSMDPYIAEVKKNLASFLLHLQEFNKDKASTYRVALIQYRDKDDLFVNKVNTDLTNDFAQIQKAVKDLNTFGGGDFPEAVLDALLVAKNDLSWNSEAKRVVILVGDAPPQSKTADGLHDESAVLDQYQTTGTQVAVYPVFAERAKT